MQCNHYEFSHENHETILNTKVGKEAWKRDQNLRFVCS